MLVQQLRHLQAPAELGGGAAAEGSAQLSAQLKVEVASVVRRDPPVRARQEKEGGGARGNSIGACWTPPLSPHPTLALVAVDSSPNSAPKQHTSTEKVSCTARTGLGSYGGRQLYLRPRVLKYKKLFFLLFSCGRKIISFCPYDSCIVLMLLRRSASSEAVGSELRR